MSRRITATLTVSVALALGTAGITACTTDGSVATGGAPTAGAGTTSGTTSGKTWTTSATTADSSVETPGLPTVAEAQARFDAVVGPDVAIEWGPELGPACIATFSIEVPPEVLVLTGQARTTVADEAAGEALLTAFHDAGARVVPSVESHYMVMAESWEALVAFIPPEDGASSAIEVTIGLMIPVADDPIPAGFTILGVDCDTKTTTSKFEAVGSPLPAEGE